MAKYLVEARTTFRVNAGSEEEAFEKAAQELAEMTGLAPSLFSLLVSSRKSWGYNHGFEIPKYDSEGFLVD